MAIVRDLSRPSIIDPSYAVSKVEPTTPQMFGSGVGVGSVTADSAAMQLAVNAGMPVFLPQLRVPYKFADIVLPHACEIYGDSFGPPFGVSPVAASYLINGDGSAPIFRVGTYGSGITDKRYIRIHGINAFNNGNSCLQLHNTPDFRVFDCSFAGSPGSGKAVVDVKFSVRGSLKNNRILGSGVDAWGLQGIDNCNGGDWSGNIVTGGSAGGAVNIGQSQEMDLRDTVIESSLIGFQIAEESGLCSAIDISNFYIEQCRDPLRLGRVFAINGLRADNGYVGNSNFDIVPDRNACLQIGRVRGLHMQGGYFVGKGAEAFIEFYKSASAPTEMSRSLIKIAERTGFGSDITFEGTIADATKVLIMGNNEIHLTENLSFGTRKEWISQPITCNVGMTQRGVVVPTTNGGQVDSIEIIEATGALDGTLGVGSTASATEVCNITMSGLTLTSNTSPITLATRLIRPGLALLVRHLVGAATTSFRVRIVYRN